MYMYSVPQQMKKICGISYMFMYRAAVHTLDAEFTILEMTTSNAFFSRELKILYHFIRQRIGRD